MDSIMQYTNGSLIPSPKDLVLALPRLAQRAGAFAFYTVPEQIDGFMGKIGVGGGSMIAEKTAAESINMTASNTTKAFFKAASSVGRTATATAAQANTLPAETLNGDVWGLQTLRNFGGMFHYLLTRWAVGTFIVSILLNRTQFYASSRTPLRLKWHTRLALYIVPMYMLAANILQTLQAARCQSSPDWGLMRYGEADKRISMDYAAEGGFIYQASSALLFWQSDRASCAAVNMASTGSATNLTELSGSLTLLWPLFLTLCLSHFIETLACALQGRQPLAETGMTIFEHSLAFCEAEAMLIKPWELAGKVIQSDYFHYAPGVADDHQISRAFLKGFMNVPPEVLLVCFISALSHLSSNLLAVLDKRKQYRLINTTIWALCYIAAFAWSISRIIMDMSETSSHPRLAAVGMGLIRFPTVCIVGFIPHIVIIVGLTTCACIYGLALLITAVSLPETAARPNTMWERFTLAYENLQANVHFSAVTPIRIHWHDDFYTTLLRAGFTVLTSATEAVYLSEGLPIRITSMTWLEKKRYDEVIKKRGLLFKKTIESIPSDLRFGSASIAPGVSMSDGHVVNGSAVIATGYAVERKSKAKEESNPLVNDSAFNDRGVGFMQRHWRWAMAFRYFQGIFWLGASFWAKCVIFVMEKLGVERRPAILIRLAGPRPTIKAARASTPTASAATQHGLHFWLLDDGGQLRLPTDNNVDVEAEMRKRVATSTTYNPRLSDSDRESQLDAQVYNWWKSGGWWGEVDSSGDYTIAPSMVDDDTTSVISMSTDASGADDDLYPDESGRRTPTQADPYTFSREETPSESHPINDALSAQHLASLLDPENLEQQNEARMLARHLRNDIGPLTRSRYNNQIARERTRILSSSRAAMQASLSAEEEEDELERFILSRRAAATGSDPAGNWNGAVCVICQSNPRTILSWPCGCLSMCDECRLGLATRNYGSCITCRTNVSAFSRVWVP